MREGLFPARSGLSRIGTCLFVAAAAFYLWSEHRAHLLGALPWLILFACPVVHLLMHGGHGGHRTHGGHDATRHPDPGAGR